MLRSLILALALATPASAFELNGEAGGLVLDDQPDSLAVLSWGLAELAVDLDLSLAGVADVEGYRTWVAAPPLPPDVRDLGLRAEPNLEALSALAPDLILGSDQHVDMAARLGRIAPTFVEEHFSAGHDNAEAARRTYLRLAAAFGKRDLAERRLQEIDAAMAAAGDRVRAAWSGEVPPVLPVRLQTPTIVRIHGANSMVTAALRGMGLTPAAEGSATDWGFTQAPVETLAEYPDAAIVHFDPFGGKETLFASPLWQAIPSVAAGRFAVAEPAWTFGGVVSLETLAERLAEALVTMGQGA